MSTSDYDNTYTFLSRKDLEGVKCFVNLTTEMVIHTRDSC